MYPRIFWGVNKRTLTWLATFVDWLLKNLELFKNSVRALSRLDVFTSKKPSKEMYKKASEFIHSVMTMAWHAWVKAWINGCGFFPLDTIHILPHTNYVHGTCPGWLGCSVLTLHRKCTLRAKNFSPSPITTQCQIHIVLVVFKTFANWSEGQCWRLKKCLQMVEHYSFSNPTKPRYFFNSVSKVRVFFISYRN